MPKKNATRVEYGPFLELSFYVPDQREADSLEKLTELCLAYGGEFAGRVRFWKEPGIGNRPFRSTTDFSATQQRGMQLSNLRTMFRDPDVRVLQVYVNDLVLERAKTTYTSFFSEAALSDIHPVTLLLIEADMFLGPGENPRVLRKVGDEVRRLFLYLVEGLKPGYAAISCEIPLLCPTDLKIDPATYVFKDFFVAAQFVGKQLIERIATLFSDGFVQRLNSGIYVSCYPWFNPDGKEIRSERSCWLSVEVAKMIGSVAG